MKRAITQKGFTFVEVLVTVTLVSVLTILAVTGVQIFHSELQSEGAYTQLRIVHEELQSMIVDKCRASAAVRDVSDPAEPSGEKVSTAVFTYVDATPSGGFRINSGTFELYDTTSKSWSPYISSGGEEVSLFTDVDTNSLLGSSFTLHNGTRKLTTVKLVPTIVRGTDTFYLQLGSEKVRCRK